MSSLIAIAVIRTHVVLIELVHVCTSDREVTLSHQHKRSLNPLKFSYAMNQSLAANNILRKCCQLRFIVHAMILYLTF